VKRALATAVLSFCALASAQSPLGLQYPLGVPDLAVTGAAAAMGGSGTAVTDEFWGASLNPANVAIGERSAFSALVSLDITTVYDNDNSGTVSGYTPKLLSLSVPLGKAGNLGFSMQKRYDANLNFYTSIQDIGEYGYKENTIELSRKGSLTAWQAGWAYRIRNSKAAFFNGLSLGILYERLYFNLDTRETFESVFNYSHETVLYRESTIETALSQFASNGIRLGIQIPAHPKVTLGATVEYIFKGDGNGHAAHEYYNTGSVYNQSGRLIPDTLRTSEREYSVTLPPSINFGAAYAANDNWLFAADAQSTLWDQYENDISERGGHPQQTYGITAGARFIPAPNRLTADYWQKISYSAGLRYSTLPHNSGDGAQDIGLSLGAGLPIPNNGGMVDIVIDIGRRTDTRYEKYSENTVKFQLGINGGRNWFQRE